MTEELDLAEFARWAIENGSWDGALGLDGGDIQEKAVACGILVKTKYDPEKHGSIGVDYCEPGDDWYEYSSAFRQARRALEPKPCDPDEGLPTAEDVRGIMREPKP